MIEIDYVLVRQPDAFRGDEGADGRGPIGSVDAIRRLAKIERARRGWFSDLGYYYVFDFKHNGIVKRHVDPEELGRDLGVLKDYELLLGSWSYPNT